MVEAHYIRWLRAHVGASKLIIVYTSAIVVDESGRVLLQRRSDFGGWGLPGGALERGEGLETCVVREVWEETGLRVVPERLVGIYSSPTFDVTYPNADQVQQFTVCFACRAAGGTLRPDGQESLDLAYFPLDGLPELPAWYGAMMEDFAAGRAEASFRRGDLGAATSCNHFLELRQFVGKAPLIIVGASVCIRDDAGRVLLIRRTDNGEWSIPAGGMELGERIDATAAREAREETGLDVLPTRVIGVYSGPAFDYVYPNGDHVHVVTTWFECRVVGGRLAADHLETSEARFFAPDALPVLRERCRVRIADALAHRPTPVWR
ncbi:MAG: NUDIX domain-containing protein [Anaerolineae bacterium]|nr:NUDIX domain-containing protein [Anaerolineae bacterium]